MVVSWRAAVCERHDPSVIGFVNLGKTVGEVDQT
jgi:hypothetical protein